MIRESNIRHGLRALRTEKNLDQENWDRSVQGAAACERFWAVKQENGHVVLEILSAKELTCRLVPDERGVWRGHWLVHEKMPVELKLVSGDFGVK